MEQILVNYVQYAENLQIEVSYDPLDAEWDTFLEGTPGGSHYQSSMWGYTRILTGWQPVRVLIKDGVKIVAGAQWNQRKYRFLGMIASLLKGPVVDPNYQDAVDPLMTTILQTCHKSGVKYLAARPPDDCMQIAKSFPKHGFNRSALNISRDASIRVDLTPDMETITSNVKKTIRKHLRRSDKDGVTVREGTKGDLPQFYSMYLGSSQRQSFNPMTLEYFERLWDAFFPSGHLLFSVAEYEGEMLSGLINIVFDDSVVGKYTGWTGDHANLYANDAVWWESIKWAKEHGYHFYDFDGIATDVAQEIMAGPPYSDVLTRSYAFRKYLFGGQVVFFPKAYDYVFNPFFRWGYKVIFPLLVAQKDNISKIWGKIRNR